MKILAQRRNSRGAISLTFLCALAIGVVSLMMVLNARTVMTMSLTSRTENVEKANALAAAAIAETKSKILADRNYGKAGEVVVVGDRKGGEWAEVSFNESAEYSSLNNLGEGAQKLGEGGVVLDPGLIQVLAVAHVRNVKVVSYEIVMAPPLPYSLGSSGAVVAGGKSLIGGVESSGVTADGLNADELVDGGVVANGMAAGVSTPLTLKDSVELVGKAKYHGGEPVVDKLTVNMNRGELEPISEPEELPQINPQKYDPASLTNNWKHETNTGAVADPAGGLQVVANAPAFYGFHRYSGPTRFDTNVVLNGGLIYVDGDVTLTKPLSGTGALVATGNVTIQGGADIKADALAAVVAGKDLTVVGTGKDAKSGQMASKFTGLLYSNGNLTLQDTRTIGSAIAAGTASGGSMMTIQDSEFLASPEGQDVSIVIQDFPDPPEVGQGNWGSGGVNYALKPTSAMIAEHPDFRTEKTAKEIAELLVKIRYGEKTYSSLAEVELDVKDTHLLTQIKNSYLAALDVTEKKITKLRLQGESTQIVRFDLNEFLNVSDRLKASRPYFIED